MTVTYQNDGSVNADKMEIESTPMGFKSITF